MLSSQALPPMDVNPFRDLLQIYRSQVRMILTVCLIDVICLSLVQITVYFPMFGIEQSIQLKVIGLLTIHLMLHWLSAKVERRIRLAIIYLFVQITLLFYMQLLTHSSILLLFLPPILAEIVVIFEALWLAPITLVLTYTLLLICQLPTISTFNIHAQLFAVSQGMILALLGISTPLAAYFLLLRSRRQASHLLINLDIAHRQLVVYAEQVEQLTVTAERARMARELHDTLAQGVVGLILQLEALDYQIGRGDNESASAMLLQIKDRARATLQGSRRAIDDLRLMPNQPSMILSSINDEASRFSALMGIPCTVDVPPSLILPTSTSEHTLRFVNEGLANITKHAKAAHVNIRIEVLEREVLLEIKDDGVGFDLTKRTHSSGHYGLLGLQERARLVGGKFELESTPHQGTTLRLYLPKLN